MSYITARSSIGWAAALVARAMDVAARHAAVLSLMLMIPLGQAIQKEAKTDDRRVSVAEGVSRLQYR